MASAGESSHGDGSPLGWKAPDLSSLGDDADREEANGVSTVFRLHDIEDVDASGIRNNVLHIDGSEGESCSLLEEVAADSFNEAVKVDKPCVVAAAGSFIEAVIVDKPCVVAAAGFGEKDLHNKKNGGTTIDGGDGDREEHRSGYGGNFSYVDDAAVLSSLAGVIAVGDEKDDSKNISSMVAQGVNGERINIVIGDISGSHVSVLKGKGIVGVGDDHGAGSTADLHASVTGDVAGSADAWNNIGSREKAVVHNGMCDTSSHVQVVKLVLKVSMLWLENLQLVFPLVALILIE
ncbi:hypothetical protein AMTR_s00045p00033260 [Amborella trichopoda]|uniref:Uncharacterized protein n=1 Tax=Amborella trichopoda TaxID=13333 RepID=W1P2V9_AMBTC|nr:hypothetical protein AMTR_s00045p00033260 [Amborella trichopoda]